MKIFFKSTGEKDTSLTTVNDEIYNQGSISVNNCYAYFAGKNPIDYLATIKFERSDGSISLDYPMINYVFINNSISYNGYRYNFADEWILAKYGELKATVTLRDGAGVVWTTGTEIIPVNQTVYDDDPSITQDQYNILLAYIAQALGTGLFRVLTEVPSDLTDYTVGTILLVKPSADTEFYLYEVYQNGSKALRHINSIESYNVVSQVEMLALSNAIVGNIAIRTDTNKSYILAKSPYSTLENWKMLRGENDLVISVNSKTGVATLNQDEIPDGTTYKQYSVTEKSKLDAMPEMIIDTIVEDDVLLANSAGTFENNSVSEFKTKYALNNVDNTTDLNKPVSTATATALSNKADLVDGFVPSGQLPSYVDDILEYANLASFPAIGETGKIYVALDTNLTYRWSGSTYTEISSSLALGETSSTAYRGDRGKTAYDHSQLTSGNPHQVLKSDLGLGNVENTTDLNKPVSTATQTALDLKANKTTTIAGVYLQDNITSSELKLAMSLNNVENTTDLNKPVSTATQIALNLKADQATTYTKTETNAALDLKADQATTYTKTETNA
ncbi:MAG: hypothetical protein WCW63_00810, partial [Acholeplasmataceae bacterium]